MADYGDKPNRQIHIEVDRAITGQIAPDGDREIYQRMAVCHTPPLKEALTTKNGTHPDEVSQ